MGDPIRILQVFGAMDRGGAEMRTLELMRRVDRRQFQLEFCALSGRAGSLAPEIRALGGEVHPCALGPGFPLRFRELLRRRRIQVVHSHVHLSSGLLLALAASAGVGQRIAHFRTTADERGDAPLRRAYRATMRGLVDRFATAIVGCGEGAIAAGWGRDWRADPRCTVILNGVDVGRFDFPDESALVRAEIGIPEGEPLLLQVGRFDRVKNHTRTIEIFALLAHRTPSHLAFLGRGGTGEERAVRLAAEAQGVADRVHFLGETTEVARYLCAADLLLMPSFHEGMPGAVLESLAAGTPVIASDLPGAREIASLLPGVAIRSLDDPDPRWTAEIRATLAFRPDTASRRAARAAFRASPFSLEVSLARHLDLWTGRDAVDRDMRRSRR